MNLSEGDAALVIAEGWAVPDLSSAEQPNDHIAASVLRLLTKLREQFQQIGRLAPAQSASNCIRRRFEDVVREELHDIHALTVPNRE